MMMSLLVTTTSVWNSIVSVINTVTAEMEVMKMTALVPPTNLRLQPLPAPLKVVRVYSVVYMYMYFICSNFNY